MLRKESEAVCEGNGPVPQQEEFGSGQPTLADVYRMMEELFDRWERNSEELFDRSDKKLGVMVDVLRGIDQRASSVEQDARQPRLAMMADGQADTKTRERTEGAATAVQAMHGDSCSANWIDPDPMCSISFGGDSTGPPALSCLGDDALVDKGAAVPKSYFSPLEMRTISAAGGFFPTDKTSTATKTTFDHPTLWLCLTEETNLGTSIQSASYNRSIWRNTLLAPPSCWRVIETNSRQNMMFDSGGSRSSPRLPVFGNVARVVLWGCLC